MSKAIEKVPVPSLVLWYPDGTTSGPGCPAIVHDDDGRGRLKLAIGMIGGSSLQWKTGVYNIADPALDENEWNRQRGAWESPAQYKKRREEMDLQAELRREEDAKARAEELRQRLEATQRMNQQLQTSNV